MVHEEVRQWKVEMAEKVNAFMRTFPNTTAAALAAAEADVGKWTKSDYWTRGDTNWSAGHTLHTHFGSLCSGTYYAQAPSGSGPLLLLDPRSAGVGVLNTISVTPRPNDMVLFPPWLMHSVARSRCSSEEPRIAVAFNSFFTANGDDSVETGEASKCRDAHEQCEEWASGGECSSNTGYMHSQCKISCGRCTPSDQRDAWAGPNPWAFSLCEQSDCAGGKIVQGGLIGGANDDLLRAGAAYETYQRGAALDTSPPERTHPNLKSEL